MEITECIKNNDVATPMRHLLRDREKIKKINFSIYREILFLSIVALEREHIDTGINFFFLKVIFSSWLLLFQKLDAFDREYRSAFANISKPKLQELIKSVDKWPNNTSVWCRRLFSPLYL